MPVDVILKSGKQEIGSKEVQANINRVEGPLAAFPQASFCPSCDIWSLDVRVVPENPQKSFACTLTVSIQEFKDGELGEVSGNYFTICEQTNSVFYFGEDVDFYENGKIVDHHGSG